MSQNENSAAGLVPRDQDQQNPSPTIHASCSSVKTLPHFVVTRRSLRSGGCFAGGPILLPSEPDSLRAFDGRRAAPNLQRARGGHLGAPRACRPVSRNQLRQIRGLFRHVWRRRGAPQCRFCCVTVSSIYRLLTFSNRSLVHARSGISPSRRDLLDARRSRQGLPGIVDQPRPSDPGDELNEDLDLLAAPALRDARLDFRPQPQSHGLLSTHRRVHRSIQANRLSETRCRQ